VLGVVRMIEQGGGDMTAGMHAPRLGGMEGEKEIRALYQQLLTAWNDQDAQAYGGLFAEDGEQVGFDGSQASGAAQITRQLSAIFTDHRTARYVSLVRSVRLIASGVGILRAEVGMAPPNGGDIVADRNAVQSLVAIDGPDGWRVALFHNTPAQFHGRPEAVDALTAELRAAVR
jgi:uncharacterized protein (TIGR02246 family)